MNCPRLMPLTGALRPRLFVVDWSSRDPLLISVRFPFHYPSLYTTPIYAVAFTG
jgi:hypothetical protein